MRNPSGRAPRAFFAAATGSDGRIYVIGGITDFDHIVPSVQSYDPPSDTWSSVAPAPTPRYGLAAAVGADGTIYAFGGNTGTSTFVDTVEAYHPSTDTWSSIAPMPAARRDLAAAAIVVSGIDSIFALGGHGSEFPLTTVEIYSP
jgi:N-acetylneuraminic acid mutarotase